MNDNFAEAGLHTYFTSVDMTTSQRTFTYGTLEADTDSWLLAVGHVIAFNFDLLDGFDGRWGTRPCFS
jgi:hypothetical protein